MSVVTKRCRDCIYYRSNSSGSYTTPTCDYILIEGHRRGCPAGDECNKFVMSYKTANGRTRLPVDEDQIFGLYMKGMNDTEISTAVGTTPGAIAAWRVRRDLPSQQSVRRMARDEA